MYLNARYKILSKELFQYKIQNSICKYFLKYKIHFSNLKFNVIYIYILGVQMNNPIFSATFKGYFKRK